MNFVKGEGNLGVMEVKGLGSQDSGWFLTSSEMRTGIEKKIPSHVLASRHVPFCCCCPEILDFFK